MEGSTQNFPNTSLFLLPRLVLGTLLIRQGMGRPAAQTLGPVHPMMAQCRAQMEGSAQPCTC